jgi:hypothetical protein
MEITNKTSRYIGAAFLLQAIASLVSSFLMAPLIVPGNINASMTNLTKNAIQMRASILGELIAVIGIVMLGSLLFNALKNQNSHFAFVALGLYLLTATIIAVSRIASFSLLWVSQEFDIAAQPIYFQFLGNLFYELQEWGYFLHMLPYTLGALIFYSLFHQSGVLPRVLSLWGIMAASLAFTGTLFDHIGYSVPVLIFLPNLPFDFGMGFWLLFKGVQGSVAHEQSINTPFTNLLDP